MSNAGVIVALDFDSDSEALALAAKLDPGQCRVKVGKELFTRYGPDLPRRLTDSGFQVFLDLKFHDIPNTVAAACRVAAETGIWMLNVHAAGGLAMLAAAREAIAAVDRPPLLIAVTVLTSLDDEGLAATGVTDGMDRQVLRLAQLAKSAGLDGVVASARECLALRETFGAEFTLVTPGIRPAGSMSDDQRRVMTPEEAVRAGSNYLVIGRPVTRARDPAAVVRAINREITSL